MHKLYVQESGSESGNSSTEDIPIGKMRFHTKAGRKKRARNVYQGRQPGESCCHFICWTDNDFWFHKLSQNFNALCIVAEALWNRMHSRGLLDGASQRHSRLSVSAGCFTLISRQANCDTVSPQSTVHSTGGSFNWSAHREKLMGFLWSGLF